MSNMSIVSILLGVMFVFRLAQKCDLDAATELHLH